MQKEKFITVMAIFDDDTQACLQNIADEFEKQYGIDTKTKETKNFEVKFTGIKHFGNILRYIEPEISEELK